MSPALWSLCIHCWLHIMTWERRTSLLVSINLRFSKWLTWMHGWKWQMNQRLVSFHLAPGWGAAPMRSKPTGTSHLRVTPTRLAACFQTCCWKWPKCIMQCALWLLRCQVLQVSFLPFGRCSDAAKTGEVLPKSRLQERNRKGGEGKRARGEDVKMRRCEDGKMRRRCEDVRRCEDEKMRRRCEEEKMRRWEDEEKMWRWEDVKMRRCEDEEKIWGWEDVKMRRCEDEKMWRWEDVKMRRCEEEKMWRWEDEEKMWGWEDVRMRRFEDEKMWRWEDLKMRRCEDEKMWRSEDVLQSPTIGRTLRSDALGRNIPVEKENRAKKAKKTKKQFSRGPGNGKGNARVSEYCFFLVFSRFFVFCPFLLPRTSGKLGLFFFVVFSSFCGLNLNKIDICEMISACFKEQMLVSIYLVSWNKVHFCDEHLHSSRISARFKGKLCNPNKVHSFNSML